MTAILDSKSKISVDMDATVGESPVNSALGSPLRVPAAQRVAVSEGDPMPRATEICIMELENQLRRAIKFWYVSIVDGELLLLCIGKPDSLH
jgi:hypothetical protein